MLDRANRLLFSADTLVSTPTLVFDYYSPILSVYQSSIEKLYHLKDAYDLIFPGHYLRPIVKQYLEDMRVCVGNIQNGLVAGTPWPHNMSDRAALSYSFGKAAIIYNEDRIENK